MKILLVGKDKFCRSATEPHQVREIVWARLDGDEWADVAHGKRLKVDLPARRRTVRL
jgi:hypothetical protein